MGLKKKEYGRESTKLLDVYRQKSDLYIPMKRRITKEEYVIRDHIAQLRTTMTQYEMADRITKSMGKQVSRRRISDIIQRMEEETRLKYSTLSSFEAMVESSEVYRILIQEGHNLLLECELVEEPEKRVEARSKAMDKIRQANESRDRLYKMTGMHQEKILHAHINLTDTDQWKNFQNAFMVYLKYVLNCPVCGHKGYDTGHFLDFLDKISKDPEYINQFFSKMVQRTHRMKKDAMKEAFDLEGEYQDGEKG